MPESGIYGAPVKKERGESVSLTSTASHLLFMPTYQEVKMYCATQYRRALCPRLERVVKYTHSGTTYTDYSSAAIDRVDANLVVLDAMGTSDILYLGTKSPVRGFYFNMHATQVNANAATLDMEYMSAISAGTATFTDVASDSDGTDSGGATLAQDGLYTFTALAAGTVKSGRISADPLLNVDLYWYRFKPSATLSASIDILDIIPAAYDTNYGYSEAGSETFSPNIAQCGAFEFDHTGTDTLYVTWIQR